MRPLAVMTVFGALTMCAPAQAELLVSISKSQQRLSVSVDSAEAEIESKRDSKPEPVSKPPARTRIASVTHDNVSVGSEAQVLRERQTWLRSIDRKYRVTR